MRAIWDHNLHFGLWTSEEDESSNRIAGLQVVELLDLTAETRRTLDRMREGARRHYDALVAAHGEVAQEYLDQLLSPAACESSLGYVLAVARV